MTDNAYRSYRINWTRFVPGGFHERESSAICRDGNGSLQDVRDFLDEQIVLGGAPIVVTEYTQSDSRGRIVPSSEWDVWLDV